MKKIALFILLSGYVFASFAQKDSIHFPRYRNGLSIELLGGAGLMSLNYERLFLSRKHSFLTAKVGLNPYDVFTDQIILSPSVTYSYGKGSHFFEAGIGSLWGHKYYGLHSIQPCIGYLLRPKSSHFYMRIYGLYNIFPKGISIGDYSGPELIAGTYYVSHIWGGVGLGYMFAKK